MRRLLPLWRRRQKCHQVSAARRDAPVWSRRRRVHGGPIHLALLLLLLLPLLLVRKKKWGNSWDKENFFEARIPRRCPPSASFHPILERFLLSRPPLCRPCTRSACFMLSKMYKCFIIRRALCRQLCRLFVPFIFFSCARKIIRSTAVCVIRSQRPTPPTPLPQSIPHHMVSYYHCCCITWLSTG